MPAALTAAAATTRAPWSTPPTATTTAIHATRPHSRQIGAAGGVEAQAARRVAQALPQRSAIGSLAITRIAEALPNRALHVVLGATRVVCVLSGLNCGWSSLTAPTSAACTAALSLCQTHAHQKSNRDYYKSPHGWTPCDWGADGIVACSP